MNQITTTCPHCATVFRVNPEQLARCEGLVKCGRCQNVFNGYETVAGSAMSPVLAPPEVDEPPVRGPRFRGLKRLIWASGVVLALTLSVVLLRNPLVDTWPELRGVFLPATDRLGLHLKLPAKLDLWEIESSDMREDAEDPNDVWLIATLRNRAAFEQAHPWLDLALLDAEGTPLEVRRIPPKEYLGQKQDPTEGLGGHLELNIKLKLKRAGIKESGYRLVLFFPAG